MKSLIILLLAAALPLIAQQTDRYVVRLDPAAAMDRVEVVAAQLAAAHGATVIAADSSSEDTIVLRLSSVQVRALTADPRVQSVTSLRVAADALVEPVDWTAGVEYAYDGADSVTRVGTDRFVYDAVGRLVQARVNQVVRNYSYDAFGNRTSCLQGSTDCQYAIDISSKNNRISETGTKYDGAGNLEIFGNHTYTYDAANMMTRSLSPGGTYEYLYAANDERLATYDVSSGTWMWTLRDRDGKVIRELSSNGSNWEWRRDYVHRGGLLLASRVPFAAGAATHRYHLDHLGTPRRVTDDGDAVVGYHDYYAFGPEIAGSVQEPNAADRKYTGHEREGLDQYTLDYMLARYYNPTLGRFNSPDPVNAADAKKPQTWNRYAYAFNDPMRYVDPNGQWPTETHNMMIEKAFPNLNFRDLATLQNASAYADNLLTGQARAASFQHGMRAPWQTIQEAQQQAAVFYKQMIAEARAAAAPGNPRDPFFALGRAMHLIMDLTSPSHDGFQVWDFNPRNIKDHMAREKRAPTDAELNMAVAMMRAAFAEVYGQAAADAASGLTSQTHRWTPPGAKWEPTPIPGRR